MRNTFVRETLGADESIKVLGEVDIANAHQLGDEIRSAMASGKPVVIDLTDCSYLDSSGAHAMVDIARAEFGALRAIVPPGGAISRVFDILHLSRYMSIENSYIPTPADD